MSVRTKDELIEFKQMARELREVANKIEQGSIQAFVVALRDETKSDYITIMDYRDDDVCPGCFLLNLKAELQDLWGISDDVLETDD